MAFTHGKETKVYVNGHNLTDMFRSASIAGSVEAAEATTFGNTSKAYVVGLKDATLSLEGLFDGAVDKVDAVLQPILGAAKSVWNVLQAGDAFGNRGDGIRGDETAYNIDSPLDGVVGVTAEVQSSVGPEPIIVHHALAARTANDTGVGIDGAAVSTAGGVGYLQVTAFSGFTSIVVTVQDSADDVSYADILTFATVTGARVAERKAITGTVRRFTREIMTVSGVGSITFWAGFGRK